MKKLRYILIITAMLLLMSVFCLAKTHKAELSPTESFEYTLEEDDKLSCELYIDEQTKGIYEVRIENMASTGARTPKLSIEVIRDGNVIYTYETESPFDSDNIFLSDKFCFYLGLYEGEYKINITNQTPFNDVTFRLNTTFVEDEYVKITPNDSFENATRLEIGKVHTGGNAREDEFDYFYFDMAEDGYAFISMNSTCKKFFCLYDESGKEIGNIPVKIEDENLMYELRTGLGKGRYYIGIVTEEDYDHSTYFLLVKSYSDTNASTKFEKEYNNEKEFATEIEFKSSYQGNLFGVEDLDIYSFDVKNDSEVVFDFSDTKVSKDAHYCVTISDGSNVVYENKEQKSNSHVLTLTNGKYYILISSRGEKYFTNMAYSISVTHKKDLALTPPLEEPSADESEVTALTLPFTDVDKGSWYYDYVKEVFSNKLMVGTSEDSFSPTESVTVAQAVTMAVRVYIQRNDIQNEFSESEGDKWYSAYAGFAKDIGMIDESFSDFERYAARSEVAHFFACSLGKVQDDYAADMDYLKELGILKGDPDGQMHPERNLTRAEAAAILTRFYNI